MRGVAPDQLLDGVLAGALRDEEAAAGAAARLAVGAGAAEHVRGSVAAQDRRDRHLRESEAAHVADERLGGVPADERPLDEVVGEAGDAGETPLDPVEDLLLAGGPVTVVLRRVAVVVPDPRIGERLVTLQGDLAGGQLQGDAALLLAAVDVPADHGAVLLAV